MYKTPSRSRRFTYSSQKTATKPNRNKQVIIALIMTVVLLLIFIVVMIFVPKNKDSGINPNTGVAYTIGQSVNQQGTIYSTGGNFNFYYILESDNGDVLGLKSNTLDLSVYSGPVVISGSVVDIKNDIPIVLVDDVVIPGEEVSEEETGSTEENTVSQTKYYFGEYGISFDFSSFTGYKAVQNSSTISIQKIGSGDEQNQEVFSISAYQCEPGTSTKDCDKQQKEVSNGRMISNSQGIKFYNISESKTWKFFNDSLWGYSVNVSDEDAFTKLTKAINIYSQDKLKSDVKSVAKSTCKNSSISMDKVEDVTIKSENGGIYAYISGTDSKSNALQCKLKLTLGEQVSAKLSELKNLGSTTPTKDSVTATTGSKMDEVYTGSTSSDSSFTEPQDMLKLESKMGYTIYFPKSLSFKQVGAQDIGLSGITCISKINAIYYKDKDNLDASPSIEVYVCKSKLGDDEISKLLTMKDFIYKPSQTTDMKFFVKATEDGQSYASQIIFK